MPADGRSNESAMVPAHEALGGSGKKTFTVSGESICEPNELRRWLVSSVWVKLETASAELPSKALLVRLIVAALAFHASSVSKPTALLAASEGAGGAGSGCRCEKVNLSST